MTKHERAIEAARELAEDREYYFDDGDLEAVIAAYLAVMREPAEDEVRVRACVAVDPRNEWFAWGQKEISDSTAQDEACSGYDDPRVTWIEANVPAWRPPAEETVEGELVG